MPSFALRNPYMIIVGALAITIMGVTAFTRMPVDVFPDIKIPAVVVATFYQGMPPLDMEDQHHLPLRALLHSGQQYRPHRIALAGRGQHHQGLFSARHRCRDGSGADGHPGDGRPGHNAARYVAAAGPSIRRLLAAGGAGDLGGQPVIARRNSKTRRATTSAINSRPWRALRFRFRLAGSSARSWPSSTAMRCRLAACH